MIRPYRDDDFEIVTALWFDAMHAAMPKMMKRMGFELEGAREYFRNAVIPENQLWVYELDHMPVAFLGMQDDFIDRLYVDPKYHRRGIGLALLDHARIYSPDHLWLYTHVANRMARAFFEKNGFVAEKFGSSPAPESEPDVEYHWRNA
ncbi:MAG: GNAT family N-acetyltransferase [Anaerolineales bacterium]|nr:MAG: GNAT family N-acetyltransferase [Anaerolineales bacterium]